MMIRKLMASSALAALVTAGALTFAQAQTEQPAAPTPAPAPAETPAVPQDPALGVDPAAPAADAAAPAADAAAPEEPPEVISDQPTLTPNQPTIASAFMGRSVFSSQDPQSDNIGDVSDLIIGQDGKITHAVIGVGGFLGIGQKDVAVPFQELQVVQQDGDLRLIYAATREQLEAAEPYDRATYDPQAREDAEQAQEQPQDPAAADPAAQPADPAQPQQDGSLRDPAGNGARAIVAAGFTLGTSSTPGNHAGPGAVILAQDATTVPADQQPAAAPPPTETEQQMESGNASAQSGTTPAAGNLTFVSFNAEQVRASTLIGQELYGTGDETIGEVSDLVLQSDGKTRAALVDVGGFLGIGEKRVSIPFDQIQMQQQPAAQTGTGDMTAAPAAGTADPAAPAATVDPAAQGAANTGSADPAAPPSPAAHVEAAEPRLVVNMTREQLEQLPEYQDPQDQAAEAAAEQQAAADPNAAGTAGIGTATTGTATTGAADAGTATTETVTTETATTGGVAGAADPNVPAATGGAVTTTTDPSAAASQESAEAQNQFQPVTTEVGTDDLMGANVYNGNDDSLGDVGDLVFDRQGALQAVVVDVGGFLGIGAKSVAIPYGSVQVMQNAGGDVRLMVDASQEQLEGAPEYTETVSTEQTGQQQPAQ